MDSRVSAGLSVEGDLWIRPVAKRIQSACVCPSLSPYLNDYGKVFQPPEPAAEATWIHAPRDEMRPVSNAWISSSALRRNALRFSSSRASKIFRLKPTEG